MTARPFTWLLLAISCYVLCSCKALKRSEFQTSRLVSALRPQLLQYRQPAILASRAEARQKRSQYQTAGEFVDTNELGEGHPNELDANLVFDTMPPHVYNQLLNMLTALVYKQEPTLLRPRPGRSSGDFQLWNYFMDDNGGGAGGVDGMAVAGDVGGSMADASLKKSAPFKPRLGKRGQMCD